MREDWVVSTLGETCEIFPGVGFPKKIQGKSKGEFPFYKVGDISKNVQAGNRFLQICDNYIDKEDIANIENKALPPKTITFAKIGEALKLNRRCLTLEYSLVDNNAIGVKASKLLCDLYLYFFFLTIRLEKYSRATTVPSVRKRDIENINIYLAPLPEQRAIVAKLEELFSDLDNGIANLKKAQAQLKVYRQAVLKKAFEGELTKEWRAKQTDLPSAEELLEKIKTERENHYQQQLNDWKQEIKQWEENGKEGKKPRKPSKLNDFNISEAVNAELPKLPLETSWLPLGNLFIESPQNGLYKPSTEYGSGTDIIRIDNFYEGKVLSTTEFKKVRLSNDEIEKYLLENDQIIINRVNSIEYLGKSGLITNLKTPTVFESNIMRLNILKSKILPKYLTHYLTSVIGIREIRRFAKHAVNQASINQTDVSLTPIPIPLIEEQHQIVQEIESRLSVCDKMEESIAESLEKAEALRQSILKKAFEGKLLTETELQACRNEPDWEPAEKLLERIKGEKEKK